MAIVATIRVSGSNRAEHDALLAAVAQLIDDAGEPPDGLMAHLAFPDADGFCIVDAWRSRSAFEAWRTEMFVEACAQAGLPAGKAAVEITDLWSFARP